MKYIKYANVNQFVDTKNAEALGVYQSNDNKWYVRNYYGNSLRVHLNDYIIRTDSTVLVMRPDDFFDHYLEAPQMSVIMDKLTELGTHVTALEARSAEVKQQLADLKLQVQNGADPAAVTAAIDAIDARLDVVDAPEA